MPDLSALIGHWGYAAVFAVVLLGNVGVPIPEETILGLSGYLAWRGELGFSLVIIVGILSAVAGDNLGYWLGHVYGRAAIDRYARAFVTTGRVEAAERFVGRYGFFGIFLARFVPVARFMAGPFSGAVGVSFGRFFVANLLGAAIYVPLVVTMGYGVGYGFGPQLEKLRDIVGRIEHIVLAGTAIATLFWLSRRVLWRKTTRK